MQQMMLVLALVLTALAGPGCIGDGEGWVKGKLWIDNCNDGDSIGESQSKQADFDLVPDFFVGEPEADGNKSAEQRRNTLAIRIQHTSNNIEESNGLLIQFNDIDLAAEGYAKGIPLDISNSGLCQGTPNCAYHDSLRATLYLFSACRDLRQPLVGSSFKLKSVPGATTDDPVCMQPDVSVTGMINLALACPTLTDADRQTLDTLCAGSFQDPTKEKVISSILGGGGACLYLCQFGDVRKGQNSSELKGTRINYGDQVAGIFSMTILDGRSIMLGTCSKAKGAISGMFSFKVVRGRSAQSFP